MANTLSAKPNKEAVFRSLSNLYKSSLKSNKRTCCVLHVDPAASRFIIFSDMHKGNRDAGDDFKKSEFNYVEALKHYNQLNYSFINLGDSEEMWKYKAPEVLPAYADTLRTEALFLPNRYYKTFGNHDLLWKNKLDVDHYLKPYFGMPLPVFEGIVLKMLIKDGPLTIFLTHGHQGDKMSDNNAFSTWLVSHLWAPVQRYLQINVNTPSKDDSLKHQHNRIMFEWSSNRKNILLVTGHTHNPVFASGKYSSHPSNHFEGAMPENIKPTYFNTGCCCFSDGDITGIELSGNFIRLVKWHTDNGMAKKLVLEERSLTDLIADLD
jgi:predicted phosphodiesterase